MLQKKEYLWLHQGKEKEIKSIAKLIMKVANYNFVGDLFLFNEREKCHQPRA